MHKKTRKTACGYLLLVVGKRQCKTIRGMSQTNGQASAAGHPVLGHSISLAYPGAAPGSWDLAFPKSPKCIAQPSIQCCIECIVYACDIEDDLCSQFFCWSNNFFVLAIFTGNVVNIWDWMYGPCSIFVHFTSAICFGMFWLPAFSEPYLSFSCSAVPIFCYAFSNARIFS